MTQLGGSLRFVQLPAVTQLLAELRSTGRLQVTQREWAGDIILREGQIVAARIGAERGRAALEAIAVAIPEGEFSFVDEAVVATAEPLVAADERAAYLHGLSLEQQRLARLIPSLNLIPRLVDAPPGTSTDSDAADLPVVIGAAAWQLIPTLIFGHTLEQVARQRGVARTLREVFTLIDAGLVRLEQPSSVAAQPPVADKSNKLVAAPSAAVAPASAPVRPMSGRQIPARPFAARSPHAPSAPQQAAPAVPAGVAARLEAARQFVAQPSPAASTQLVQPGHAEAPAAASGWRKAIVGFFVNDSSQPAGAH